MLNIFTRLKKIEFFKLEDMSPKKSIFFYALPYNTIICEDFYLSIYTAKPACY